MRERVGAIGKVTQSMCEAVRRAVEVLPTWCPEMQDVSVVTLGPFMHVDVWSPVLSEKEEEREEGRFVFLTTMGFAGKARFYPQYPKLEKMGNFGLLDGEMTLDLDRHEKSGFPGRHYRIKCQWMPHLQKHLLKFVYAGAIPPTT